MVRIFKLSLYSICFGLAVCVVLSFLGSFLPVGDSLAVFRIPLLVLVFISALIYRGRTFIVLSIFLAGLGLVSDARYRFGYDSPKEGSYRVYQKNLSFRLKDQTDLIQDITESGANIVTLQEVTTHNKNILHRLNSTFPNQLWCPFASVGGVAVLSQYPVETSICDFGIVVGKFKVKNEYIWVGSIHLHWPWPHEQANQVEEMVPLLESLDAPVILAGDLNAVPWSGTVKKLSDAINGHRVGPYHPSFDLFPGFSITIDHVIAGGRNYKTEQRPKFGSDHYGLIADVDPAIRN